jgi:hypothetical protein
MEHPVKHTTEIEKPDCIITYVRENYCKKAVESPAQVKFLVKHYGVAEAAGAKVHGSSKKFDERWKKADSEWTKQYSSDRGVPKTKRAKGRYNIIPSPTPGNVWGELLNEDEL